MSYSQDNIQYVFFAIFVVFFGNCCHFCQWTCSEHDVHLPPLPKQFNHSLFCFVHRLSFLMHTLQPSELEECFMMFYLLCTNIWWASTSGTCWTSSRTWEHFKLSNKSTLIKFIRPESYPGMAFSVTKISHWMALFVDTCMIRLWLIKILTHYLLTMLIVMLLLMLKTYNCIATFGPNLKLTE